MPFRDNRALDAFALAHGFSPCIEVRILCEVEAWREFCKHLEARQEWSKCAVCKRQFVAEEERSFDLRIDGINHGLGFSVFERSGKRDTVACVSITPVRDGCTEVQIAAIAEGDGDMTEELAELDDFLSPDVPIFQRKIYRADPILCEKDGHVAEFRRWARQFYPPAAPVSEPQARVEATS